MTYSIHTKWAQDFHFIAVLSKILIFNYLQGKYKPFFSKNEDTNRSFFILLTSAKMGLKKD